LSPAPLIPIPDADPDFEDTASEHVVETEAGNPSSVYRTDPDSYGVIREYLYGQPSITPDKHYTLTEISDSPYIATDDSSDSEAKPPTFLSPLQKICQSATSSVQTLFAPFRNVSIYRLMTWFYSSSTTKSIAELNSLVKNVILAPDFKLEDLVGFDTKKEHSVMDSYQESPAEILSPFAFDDTWIKGSVEIPLPCDGVKLSEEMAPKFIIEVYYRKLIDVIQAALSSLLPRNSIPFHSKNSGNPILTFLKNGSIQKAILVTGGMKSMRRFMQKPRKDRTVTSRRFLLPL
jgi:hypothetical protein